MIQDTLSIIKPDAVAGQYIGAIYQMCADHGLQIVAARLTYLTRAEAERFYAVHSHRPFFKDLIDFMVSGPVMVQVLRGEESVARYRELMGATDPKTAHPSSIRGRFAQSIDQNAVHGSDSAENAALEIAFFFSQRDLVQ